MQVISNMIEAHIFREVKNGIEFLLLKRNENQIYPGLWQMVTGKMKDGETAYQSALREIKEETSLTPAKFWVVPNVDSFYSHENNYISMMPVFAALVDHNSSVKISDEHCDYKWVNPEEAKKLLVWVGQRNSVDIISNILLKKSISLALLRYLFRVKKYYVLQVEFYIFTIHILIIKNGSKIWVY